MSDDVSRDTPMIPEVFCPDCGSLAWLQLLAVDYFPNDPDCLRSFRRELRWNCSNTECLHYMREPE